MNFIELAKRRYSVRNYTDRKVETEKLEKILEAAHVAPTAANLQPVRLIVVRSKEGLEKIGKGANIYGAPLAIIVCADHSKAWVRPYDKKQTADIDASILTDHMMMEATELGWALCGSAISVLMLSAKSFPCRTIWSPSISWRWDIRMRRRLIRSVTLRGVLPWMNWYCTSDIVEIWTGVFK